MTRIFTRDRTRVQTARLNHGALITATALCETTPASCRNPATVEIRIDGRRVTRLCGPHARVQIREAW